MIGWAKSAKRSPMSIVREIGASPTTTLSGSELFRLECAVIYAKSKLSPAARGDHNAKIADAKKRLAASEKA